MSEKSYIFALNYGERTKEKCFIKDILKRYDINTLVGAGIFVNNNPYNLELVLFLNFIKNDNDFEEWLNNNYKNKKRVYNYFHTDLFESFATKGYNLATFCDENTVDMIVTSEANDIFLFPDKKGMKSIWKTGIVEGNIKVFLSHSSKDKNIVDKIFNEVQKNEIRAWYDKYEIKPGDSITDKINEGLENSDIGIICISKNFLNSSTGWPKSELNYFIQRRMRSNKNDFICINLDVPHEELPPLVQDYRYIDINQEDGLEILINTLNHRKRK